MGDTYIISKRHSTTGKMGNSYKDLNDKPKINNVELLGNKTADDLSLVKSEPGKGLSENDFTDEYKTNIEEVREEVRDSRISYDGKIFDTAGNAIRGQISSLSESITKISNNYVNKNILPLTTSKSSRGVEFAVNDDGSINISGTATGGNAIYRYYYKETVIPEWLKVGKVYCIYLDNEIENVKVTVQGFKQDGTTVAIVEKSEKAHPFKLPTDIVGIAISLIVNSGATVNGTLKVNISNDVVLHDITETENMVQIKNALSFAKDKTVKSNGIRFIIDKFGSINISGTASGTENAQLRLYYEETEFPNWIKKEKKYLAVVSKTISNITFNSQMFRADGTYVDLFSTNDLASFSIPTEAVGLAVSITVQKGTTVNDTIDVCILDDRCVVPKILERIENVADVRSELLKYANLQSKKIVTWIDDDTVSVTAIEKVKTICDELGMKSTFGCITGRATEDVISALKEYQRQGFHITTHTATHTRWYKDEGGEPIYTPSERETDLIISIEMLRENGFIDSDFIIYPGTSLQQSDVKPLAMKWCRGGVDPGDAYKGVNYLYGAGKYKISREFINKGTDVSVYKAYIDSAEAKENSWLVFGTHSGSSSDFDPVLTKGVLSYALSKGYVPMTLNEAMKYREALYKVGELYGVN